MKNVNTFYVILNICVVLLWVLIYYFRKLYYKKQGYIILNYFMFITISIIMYFWIQDNEKISNMKKKGIVENTVLIKGTLEEIIYYTSDHDYIFKIEYKKNIYYPKCNSTGEYFNLKIGDSVFLEVSSINPNNARLPE